MLMSPVLFVVRCNTLNGKAGPFFFSSLLLSSLELSDTKVYGP